MDQKNLSYICSLFTSVPKYQCYLDKWVLCVKVLPITTKWKQKLQIVKCFLFSS